MSEVRGRPQDESKDGKISQFKDICLLILLSYALHDFSCFSEVANPASEFATQYFGVVPPLRAFNSRSHQLTAVVLIQSEGTREGLSKLKFE